MARTASQPATSQTNHPADRLELRAAAPFEATRLLPLKMLAHGVSLRLKHPLVARNVPLTGFTPAICMSVATMP